MITKKNVRKREKQHVSDKFHVSLISETYDFFLEDITYAYHNKHAFTSSMVSQEIFQKQNTIHITLKLYLF